MKSRLFVCALCCAGLVSCLISGCSEVNPGNDTDIAKLSLPKDVIDRAASRPVDKRQLAISKQLARRSSPPIVHHN